MAVAVAGARVGGRTPLRSGDPVTAAGAGPPGEPGRCWHSGVGSGGDLMQGCGCGLVEGLQHPCWHRPVVLWPVLATWPLR